MRHGVAMTAIDGAEGRGVLRRRGAGDHGGDDDEDGEAPGP